MATAKQLAALAKGRAARKKKLASKSPKKRVYKEPKKAAVKTVKKTLAKYLVKITNQAGKCGYYVRDYAPGAFETDVSKATKLSKAGAEGAAIAIFNKFKRSLKQVEVVNAKK